MANHYGFYCNNIHGDISYTKFSYMQSSIEAPPGEYRHSTISVKAPKAINNQQTNNAQISQNSFTLWFSSKFAVS